MRFGLPADMVGKDIQKLGDGGRGDQLIASDLDQPFAVGAPGAEDDGADIALNAIGVALADPRHLCEQHFGDIIFAALILQHQLQGDGGLAVAAVPTVDADGAECVLDSSIHSGNLL